MRSLSAKLRVARVADRQWGLVTATQLAALGIDTAVVSRWLRDGYLYRIHPGVYAVAHRGGSVERDLAAALFYAGPGAMLSHATALWWFGLLDHQPWPIQVCTPRRCRSVHGVQVHQRRAYERVWHRRLPVTSVERALLDFAAIAPFDRLRYALAVADYMKLVDLEALHATAGQGKAGSAKLRRALKRHEPRLARTRSWLERLFVPLCERAGIPLPEINVKVAGVLVDAVWRDRRLVVELDGKDNHSSWAQIQDDRDKELTLRGAGFDVIRYVTRQVQDQPARAAADLGAQVRKRDPR